MIKKILSIFMGILLIANCCFAGIDFAGDADYINVADANVFSSISFSLGGLFTFDAVVTTLNNRNFLISKGSSGAYEWELSAWGDGTGVLLRAIIYNTVVTGFLTAVGSTRILNGETHYVVATMDNSTNTLNLYLDGVLDGTDNTTTGTRKGNDVAYVSIGWRGDLAASGVNFPFNGKITDVFYNTASFSLGEVKQLSNSKIKGIPYQIQPLSLVGYWPLDDKSEGSGINTITFVDRAGADNNGTAVDADGDSKTIGEKVLSYPYGAVFVDAYAAAGGGWTHDYCGVPNANIDEINGIPKENIEILDGI